VCYYHGDCSLQLCYHKSGQSLPVGSNRFIWGECACVRACANAHADMCVLVCVCVCLRTSTATPLTRALHAEGRSLFPPPPSTLFCLNMYIYMHIYTGVCAYISIYIFSSVSFLDLESGGEIQVKIHLQELSLKRFVNKFRSAFFFFSWNGRRRPTREKKNPEKNTIIKKKKIFVYVK